MCQLSRINISIECMNGLCFFFVFSRQNVVAAQNAVQLVEDAGQDVFGTDKGTGRRIAFAARAVCEDKARYSATGGGVADHTLTS